ncbi:MAG: hypothetical protein ACRDI2_21550 [Chloroflexota bacterium]
MARRLLSIGAALFAILAPAVASVVAAQEATQQVASCMPGDRSLTGAWTTTETVDGQNTSLWRGSLQLVQRGGQVVGRWEPPGGAPERVIAGSFARGLLRVTQRSTPDLPAAEVEAAPPRSWTLSLSTDGRLLSGRWTEPAAGGAARQGDLFATGEAGCGPAAPPPPPSEPAPASCLSWDLSGVWEVAASPPDAPPWRLWLLQDGETLLGWYEARSPSTASSGATLDDLAAVATTDAPRPLWVVDGRVRGRLVLLEQHAGDSTTIARTLLLDPEGHTLSGGWPLSFGPPETEVLQGEARCLDTAP